MLLKLFLVDTNGKLTNCVHLPGSDSIILNLKALIIPGYGSTPFQHDVVVRLVDFLSTSFYTRIFPFLILTLSVANILNIFIYIISPLFLMKVTHLCNHYLF